MELLVLNSWVTDTKLTLRFSNKDRTGFKYCLFDTAQKFQSDSERRLAVILEREKLKWFRPAKGQFQIFYKSVVDHLEYQPDFVTESSDCIYMLEPKAANQMNEQDVVSKRDAAAKWCEHASAHTMSYGGKPWKYVLIPHDAIVDNMTIAGLADRFGCAA
jgi:type III restriction enzyme